MNKLLIYLLLLLTAASCTTESFTEQVERELASGKKQDSLFLDIHFGMTRKDFYAHCWELNKQDIIRQGTRNTTVLYELPDQLGAEATLDFYPDFHNGKIYQMPLYFSYTAWAPWNPELGADSLLVNVSELLGKWYNKPFRRLEHPEKGVAYVQVQGNRKILIHRADERTVRALITDTSVEPQVVAGK